jgi:hypothetical protein
LKNRSLQRKQHPSFFFQQTRMKIGYFLASKMPMNPILVDPKKKAAKMVFVFMEVKLIRSFSLKRFLNERRQASYSKGKQTKINTVGAKLF